MGASISFPGQSGGKRRSSSVGVESAGAEEGAVGVAGGGVAGGGGVGAGFATVSGGGRTSGGEALLGTGEVWVGGKASGEAGTDEGMGEVETGLKRTVSAGFPSIFSMRLSGPRVIRRADFAGMVISFSPSAKTTGLVAAVGTLIRMVFLPAELNP